jgi:hypothetical protein
VGHGELGERLTGGASGGVAAGHRGGAVAVGDARWGGGVPAREMRGEELGEG